MAIFSRRDIQGAVNQLKDCLSSEQLRILVGRLNGDASGSLATEWEAVILAAFSKCGRTLYEKEFGGTTKPDVFFRMGQSGSLEFAAEIRAVSDADAHEKNPYEQFQDAIRRFLLNAGRSSAGLHVHVENIEEGEYGNRKLRLTLPAKAEMDCFVRAELRAFLIGISEAPDTDAFFQYNQRAICFSLRYDAKQKRFGGDHHISYTVPYSLQRNVLSHSFKEKRKQLKKSGYTGIKGIIVCDGGCDALNERSRVGGAFGCQEIVYDFLDSQSSVSWILVLRIEQMHTLFPREKSIGIKPKLYWNRDENSRRFRDTASALDRMLEHLPRPEATPTNALNWLKDHNRNMGRPLGGVTMQDKAIKILCQSLDRIIGGQDRPESVLGRPWFQRHRRPSRRHAFL